MRLRTRLTTGVTVMFAVALGLCCILISQSVKRSLLDEVKDYTIHENESLCADLAECVEANRRNLNKNIHDTYLRYYFSDLAAHALAGSEYVLQREDEILYNNSGIDAVNALQDEAFIQTESYKEVHYRILHLGEGDYLLTGQTKMFFGEEHQVAVVRDITAVYTRIRMLTLRCALICAVTCLGAVFFALFFFGRALKPLLLLRQGAASIAAGDYSGRIDIDRKDELGDLARTFDGMAASVQEHVRQIEAKSEEQNMLLHALAHEMKTPVTAIAGYTYALSYMNLSREQKKESVAFIDSESRRLERLSEKLTQLITATDYTYELPVLDLGAFEQELQSILNAPVDRFIDNCCERDDIYGGTQFRSEERTQCGKRAAASAPGGVLDDKKQLDSGSEVRVAFYYDENQLVRDQPVFNQNPPVHNQDSPVWDKNPLIRNQNPLMNNQSQPVRNQNQPVRGDRDLLILLVTNLVDNAKKAGASRIDVIYCEGTLSVTDNGSGIAPSQIDKIMQPFYQADASRNHEGFGLGLALCRRIAEIHGTKLSVESKEGEGSRFCITFSIDSVSR